MRDPYKFLNVPYGVDEATLGKRYREFASKLHGDAGGSDEMMKLVNEARAQIRKHLKEGIKFKEGDDADALEEDAIDEEELRRQEEELRREEQELRDLEERIRRAEAETRRQEEQLREVREAARLREEARAREESASPGETYHTSPGGPGAASAFSHYTNGQKAIMGVGAVAIIFALKSCFLPDRKPDQFVREPPAPGFKTEFIKVSEGRKSFFLATGTQYVIGTGNVSRIVASAAPSGGTFTISTAGRPGVTCVPGPASQETAPDTDDIGFRIQSCETGGTTVVMDGTRAYGSRPQPAPAPVREPAQTAAAAAPPRPAVEFKSVPSAAVSVSNGVSVPYGGSPQQPSPEPDAVPQKPRLFASSYKLGAAYAMVPGTMYRLNAQIGRTEFVVLLGSAMVESERQVIRPCSTDGFWIAYRTQEPSERVWAEACYGQPASIQVSGLPNGQTLQRQNGGNEIAEGIGNAIGQIIGGAIRRR